MCRAEFHQILLRLICRLLAKVSTMGIKSCHCYYPDRATFDILLKFSIRSKRADMEKVLCAVYMTNVVVIIHYLPFLVTPSLVSCFVTSPKAFSTSELFSACWAVYLCKLPYMKFTDFLADTTVPEVFSLGQYYWHGWIFASSKRESRRTLESLLKPHILFVSTCPVVFSQSPALPPIRYQSMNLILMCQLVAPLLTTML